MALTQSTQTPFGSAMPAFELKCVDGNHYSSQQFNDKDILVVMFICNHCPYVQAVEERIIKLVKYFAEDSVQFIGICSNDYSQYPDDAPVMLAKRAAEKGYGFPYLVDQTQVVAKAFGAVCTPDIFVYDKKRCLFYHGRIDDNWQHPEKVNREDLKLAITAALSGGKPASEQYSSLGCSIKWMK